MVTVAEQLQQGRKSSYLSLDTPSQPQPVSSGLKLTHTQQQMRPDAGSDGASAGKGEIKLFIVNS